MGGPRPHVETKLRPKGPKKIFFETTPPLSEGLDRPLPLPIGEVSLKCYLPSKKNVLSRPEHPDETFVKPF